MLILNANQKTEQNGNWTKWSVGVSALNDVAIENRNHNLQKLIK